MKNLKKAMRLFALALFIALAALGMGLSGIAPTLTKDRKLFADSEWVYEEKKKENPKESNTENLKF